MRVKRERCKFKFWLNISNTRDRALAENLEALKANRQLTPYIREGIKLYKSLKEEANLNTLFDMFPWVKELVLPQIDAIVALQKQMTMLEEALVKSGHQEIPFSRSLVKGLDEEEDSDTEPLTLQVAFMEVSQ